MGGFGPYPADGACAFEILQAVVFAIPVVDLRKQPLPDLFAGAGHLDFEPGTDFLHAGLHAAAVGVGAHGLLVVSLHPVVVQDRGDGGGLSRLGCVVIQVGGCRGDRDRSVRFQDRVVEMV